MFTWICPQCGGEVLPSQDECPRCVRAANLQPAPPPEAESAVVPQMPAAAPVAAALVAPIYTPMAPSYMPPPEPSSTGLRDVLVTVGVAAVLLGAGYYFWTRAERGEKPAGDTKARLESVTGARSTHPMAKYIEVTGIRLRMPKPGQAEVQLLVVNHSAAEIAALSMEVVLVGKGTTKEVAVFPVTVKRLGPFGSAEVTAKAKTTVSAIDLPDWQFLEPKVVVQANEP